MSNYKLMSIEPTPEMVKAARDSYMRFGYMEMAIRMALAAAPAVQREPVGRVKTVGGYPDESEHTIEWLCKYKDLKDGDLLYAGPRPAEQQSTPDVAALVEALEGIMRVEARDRVMPVGAEWDAARAALAAYRKGSE